MPTRRQFLKTGLTGAALLAAGGGWFALSGRDAEIRALLCAIGSAVLDGALPTDEAARQRALDNQIEAMQTVIAGLGATAQGELRQLFGLVTFPPTRLLLTGLGHGWAEVNAAEAAQFLEGWRNSRFDLLRSAYAALHDIALGAWYGVPAHWPAIGYPGPPEVPRAPA